MSEDLHILSNQVLPNFSLVKEYELIAHYSDWSNSQKSKKLAEQSPSSNPSPSNLKPYELPDLNIEGGKVKENSSSTAAPASSGYNSNNYTLPNIGQPTTAASNPQPAAVSATQPINPAPTNEYLVMRMMQETGQDRDICYFLLESVNWDFDAAMEIMMQNLQVK